MRRARPLCVSLKPRAPRRERAAARRYPKSKTLAEARAWALAEELGVEVATVNPSYVIGPLLSARDCSSAVLVKRLLTNDMPAVPKLWIPSVDVRDVADAHVARRPRVFFLFFSFRASSLGDAAPRRPRSRTPPPRASATSSTRAAPSG